MYIHYTLGAIFIVFILCVHCDNADTNNEILEIYGKFRYFLFIFIFEIDPSHLFVFEITPMYTRSVNLNMRIHDICQWIQQIIYARFFLYIYYILVEYFLLI